MTVIDKRNLKFGDKKNGTYRCTCATEPVQ